MTAQGAGVSEEMVASLAPWGQAGSSVRWVVRLTFKKAKKERCMVLLSM